MGISNYIELKKITLREIKTKNNKKLANIMLDICEKTGKDIKEAITNIDKLKIADKNTIEEFKNRSDFSIDDKIVSDYEQEMNENGYGLYSNFDEYSLEFKPILEYLKQNDIDFIIGEAHDILSNKIKNSNGLYIKGWSHNQKVKEIIDNMPEIEYSTEELLAYMLKRNKDYREK